MWQILSIALYPVVVYLCTLIGWRYGKYSIEHLRKEGLTKAVALRLGIVVGFCGSVLGNTVLWGAARLSEHLGWEALHTMVVEASVNTAFGCMLFAIMAALLHLYAIDNDKKNFYRDVPTSLAIFILTVFTLLGLGG